MCNVVAVLCSSDFAILLSRQQRVATPPPSLAISSLSLSPLTASPYPLFSLVSHPDPSRVPPFFTRFRPSFPTRSVTPVIPTCPAISPLFPILFPIPQVPFDTHLEEKKTSRLFLLSFPPTRDR